MFHHDCHKFLFTYRYWFTRSQSWLQWLIWRLIFRLWSTIHALIWLVNFSWLNSPVYQRRWRQQGGKTQSWMRAVKYDVMRVCGLPLVASTTPLNPTRKLEPSCPTKINFERSRFAFRNFHRRFHCVFFNPSLQRLKNWDTVRKTNLGGQWRPASVDNQLLDLGSIEIVKRLMKGHQLINVHSKGKRVHLVRIKLLANILFDLRCHKSRSPTQSFHSRHRCWPTDTVVS